MEEKATIVNLPRKYRKQYVSEMGWATFDLNSAQYLIAVAVPGLDRSWAERIVAGESLWSIIQQNLSKPVSKDTIKTSIYSILFGAGAGENSKTEKAIKNNWEDKDLFLEYLNIPEIKELIHSRNKELRRLAQVKYVVDCNGEIFSHYKAPTLLSYLIQSYELNLILPLLEYVIDSSHTEIALHLHDGFSVNCRDKKRLPGLYNSLQKVLEETAKKLGVLAKLEWENKGDN